MSPAAPNRILRILVIEDHTALGRTVARLLRARGHRVSLASSADRALELGIEHTFDLVITDCSFSSVTSVGLARDLKSVQPELRAIALTAAACPPETVTQAGFDLHVPRPTRMAELDDAILFLFPESSSCSQDARATAAPGC